GDKRRHDGATDFLAEVAELLADCQPVCVAVPVVRQLTMSRTRRRKRGATAWGRTMERMEKGRDSTRYPPTIAIAITKNLQFHFPPKSIEF
ncbi:hypothetical protein LINPERPRIM_LOCUS26807, partial [Linum perenne]